MEATCVKRKWQGEGARNRDRGGETEEMKREGESVRERQSERKKDQGRERGGSAGVEAREAAGEGKRKGQG